MVQCGPKQFACVSREIVDSMFIHSLCARYKLFYDDYDYEVDSKYCYELRCITHGSEISSRFCDCYRSPTSVLPNE